MGCRSDIQGRLSFRTARWIAAIGAQGNGAASGERIRRGEGIDHQPDENVVAETGLGRPVDAVEKSARFARRARASRPL